MSLESITYLLRRYNIRPDDRLGQHFLVSDDILRRIVSAAGLTRTDRVLEIGAGVGNLTAILAQTCERVVAVEQDIRFKPLLNAFAGVNKNVHVIFDDILRLPFATVERELGIKASASYAIVANIPYYLTSKLIERVLHYTQAPRIIVFLIQREVAERIVSRVGDYSKLALSVQLYGTPRIVFEVPRHHFYPAPDVDSAVLTITGIHAWNYDVPERVLWRVIAFGFSAKRKKLVNNLSAGFHTTREAILERLERAKIDPNARAQELSIDQWLTLARLFSEWSNKLT